MTRRPTEHHRKHTVSHRSGTRQKRQLNDCFLKSQRKPTSPQQTNAQNAPRQTAGNRRHQQSKAQKTGVSSKGDQRQQDPHRQLYGRSAKHSTARMEHRHGVPGSRKSRPQIPSPAQRDPRKTCRQQQDQIIHDPVEKKHTVQINDRYTHPSLSFLSPDLFHYKKTDGEKPSEKHGRFCRNISTTVRHAKKQGTAQSRPLFKTIQIRPAAQKSSQP